MARTGNPYDNAIMENFFKTLKHEEVNLCEYETYQDVINRFPYFLEEVLLSQENNEIPRQTLLTLSVQS